MKINYIFKKLLLIIGLLLFLIAPNKCWAGGILYLHDGQKWNLQNFSKESYISYQNGLQKLILNINFYQEKSSAQKGLLIFPLPCSLNDVNLSLKKEIPRLYARDLNYELLEKIDNFNLLSNVFSFLFSALSSPLPFIGIIYDGGTPGYYMTPQNTHTQIIQYKISSELVKFDKINDFKTYLSSKSIYLDEKFDKIIGDYINHNYIFVLAYLNEPKTVREKHNFLCITSEMQLYIKFKSNKIYYPLKLSSIYDNVINNNLFIFGFKSPQLYQEISKDTKIKYYSGGSLKDTDDFFPSNALNYTWTGLEIKTNPKNLLYDLFIIDQIPFNSILLSSFFYYIYIPISSIVYIFIAFIVYYLLFLFFCNKNIPNIKFILFLSISFFISHLFTFIYSYIIKLDEKICNEQNDELDIEGKTNSKTQNKMFIAIIITYFIAAYYHFYYNNILQLIFSEYFWGIIILFWIVNRFFNTILLNFYIIFYISFVILNSIYHHYIYNLVKTFLCL